MICSRVARAETSIIRVLRGTWKLVIKPSTTWKVEPGMRKRLVFSSARAVMSPWPQTAAESGAASKRRATQAGSLAGAAASQALSSERTDVVPTAITL